MEPQQRNILIGLSVTAILAVTYRKRLDQRLKYFLAYREYRTEHGYEHEDARYMAMEVAYPAMDACRTAGLSTYDTSVCRGDPSTYGITGSYSRSLGGTWWQDKWH